MPNAITGTCTLGSETATTVADGYAGFGLGCTYQLQTEHRGSGTVPTALDHHEPVSEESKLILVTQAQ